MVYTSNCKRPLVVAPEKTEEFLKLKRDEKTWSEIEKSASEFEKNLVSHKKIKD